MINHCFLAAELKLGPTCWNNLQLQQVETSWVDIERVGCVVVIEICIESS